MPPLHWNSVKPSEAFMEIRKVQINWILLFLAGLMSLYFIVLFYASLNDAYLDQVFNTDSLYLPSLYNDFFIEHGMVSSWHFNPSPNFVPDMLLYFPINFLTGNFRLTALIFSLIQQTILLVLLYALFRKFFGKGSNPYTPMIFLLSIAFIVQYLIANEYYLNFLFVSNTFHFGIYLMALLCLILAFRFIEKKNFYVLILIIVLQIIAFLSDRLFLVLFTGPAFITFALNWKNRRSLILAIAVIIAALIGFILFNNLNTYFHIRIGTPHRINKISYFYESLHTFIEQVTIILAHHSLVSLLYILSFVSFIFSGIIVIGHYRAIYTPEKPQLPLLYLCFSFFFYPMVILAPIFNGNFTGFDTLRYVVFAPYLAIFNIPLILWFYRSYISRRIIQAISVLVFAGFLVFGIVLTLKINPVKQIGHIANYYPAYIERVDKIATEENLKFGLANYWDAKFITMFSKSGIKVYSAKDDLNAYYHVSNEDWYYGCSKCETGEKEFNFVIFDRFQNRDVINSLINNGARLIQKDGLELLITKPFVMSRKTYKPVMND